MKESLGPYAFLPDHVDFMIWGDLEILKAAQTLPEDQYHKNHNISAGSLHDLLVHAMNAQWVWLHRFQGKALTFADIPATPTRDALAKRWPEVHTALRAYINAQTLDSLNTVITYKNMLGHQYTQPVGHCLLHVTDHGTYHRGQQNTLLKLAGYANAPVNCFFYKWKIDHP